MNAPSRTNAHSDVAQETRCRFLRVRRALHSDGSVAAYLAAVATNLWRDGRRTERRAGCLSSDRLLSLDASVADDDGALVMAAVSIPRPLALADDEAIALDIWQSAA